MCDLSLACALTEVHAVREVHAFLPLTTVGKKRIVAILRELHRDTGATGSTDRRRW
jgi:hypothetical protein